MEIYSLDWGAIATFTGAGVALYISKEWRYEKRSELLANKAQIIIDKKERLIDQFNRYIKQIILCINDQYLEMDRYRELDRLEDKYYDLKRSNSIIDETYNLIYKYRIKDKDTKIAYEKYKEFSKKFDTLYGYREVSTNLRQGKIRDKDSIYHSISEIHNEFDQLIDLIESDLINYIFHNKNA